MTLDTLIRMVCLLAFVASAGVVAAQDPPLDETPAESTDDTKFEDLPRFEDVEIPSAEVLLGKENVTWVIFLQERVLVTGPIAPRPNTLATLQAEIDKMVAAPQPQSLAERAQRQEQLFALRKLQFTLPGAGEALEFALETKWIKDIWHHEDLMLKRAALQMETGDRRTAYELLYALQQINDQWPGLETHLRRLLFVDGSAALEEGRHEFALARFEELFALDAGYDQLSATLGRTIDGLIESSVENDDYRRGRHFLNRLRARVSDHPVVVRWERELLSRMQAKMAAARTASEAGRHDVAAREIDDATRIWPNSIPLRDLHRALKTRYQTLRSGVLQLAGAPSGLPFPTDADARYLELVNRPLFETSACADVPRYRTAWFETWEPTELGRNVVLQLRTDREYWNPLPEISSVDLMHAFGRRLDERSPEYNERLAAFVRRVTARSSHELEIEFSRVPLRLEALLAQPLTGSASGSSSGSSDDGGVSSRPVGYYREIERADRLAVFAREQPEPDGAGVYHLAEVRERAYESEEELLRGVLRGELDFVPRVPLFALGTLQADPEWVVRSYALPEVHLLQFHPRSLAARSQEIRRALYFAIDREELLRETILRGAPPDAARLTSAPFPRQLYGFALGVRQAEPDLRVALSLALAAHKAEGGSLPTWRMVCDPDPNLRAAAERMIERWRRIGLTVELVDSAAEEGAWDIACRRVVMEEPLTQLWPFLTQSDSARVDDLQGLPGWLRQQLIELELSTNWESAVGRLKSIHTDLWSELHVIPLWEVDRFLAHHRTIRGVPDAPLRCYQDLELRVVEPWFDQRNP